MQIFPASLLAWEFSGSASSLLQLLTTVRTDLSSSGVSAPWTVDYYGPRDANLSACLSGRTVEHFTHMLRSGSLGTLELVSISQPYKTLRPLNRLIIMETGDGAPACTTNSGERKTLIAEVQMNGFVTGGVTFANLTIGNGSFTATEKSGERSDTRVSVVVRHCPFYQTLLLSPGTLGPTSRLLAAVGSLATKDCALFVIRSLKELPQSVGVGRGATAELHAGEFNSWNLYMERIPWSLNGFIPPSGNGDGGGSSGLLETVSSKRCHFVRRFPSGPTTVREWPFARGSLTPFKKTLSSTLTLANGNPTAPFEYDGN